MFNLCVVLFFFMLPLYTKMKEGVCKHFWIFIKKVPGPWTIYWSIKWFPGGILNYFGKLQKSVGDVVKSFAFSETIVQLTDPQDVEVLLSNDLHEKKPILYEYLRPYLGEGLARTKGKRWQAHRGIVTSAMNMKLLENSVKSFCKKGDVLVASVKRENSDGVLDIYPYISDHVIRTLLDIFIGVSSSEQDDKSVAEFISAKNKVLQITLKKYCNWFMRKNWYYSLTGNKQQYEDSLDTVRQFIGEVVEKRMEARKKRKTEDEVLLDRLLNEQEVNTRYNYSNIIEEINSLIFSSHDATTAAIAFTLYYLSENQDVQEKVRKEIKEIDETELNLEILKNAKYLDQVIRESLRLSPPMPFISRELTDDIKLKDLTVPRLSTITVVSYLIQRDPRNFTNPEVFNPENFNEQHEASLKPYTYLPFGAGARKCPGQLFAENLIKTTVIKFIKDFKILPGKSVKHTSDFLFLYPVKGVCVKLEKSN